jgi:hypothetical protein
LGIGLGHGLGQQRIVSLRRDLPLPQVKIPARKLLQIRSVCHGGKYNPGGSTLASDRGALKKFSAGHYNLRKIC